MEPENMDDFELELRQALIRRPAPPSLKRRVMERRRSRKRGSSVAWKSLAASLVLVALLAGGLRWGLEQRDAQRRGDDARRQVMLALRVTSQALKRVNTRLTAHDRDTED